MPKWSISIDHFLSILRSRLPLRDKFSLTRCLLRDMRWQRGKLWAELCTAVMSRLVRGGASPLPPRSATT
jgi:hypothetical protein